MSRLNRAFIKAFEREQEANLPSALLDRVAPTQSNDSWPAATLSAAKPTADRRTVESPATSTITRVDSPAQFSLPRIKADVSMPTTRSLKDPYPSLPTAAGSGDPRIVAAVEQEESGVLASAEPTVPTWTPPFAFEGPTDWRAVVIQSPEAAPPGLRDAQVPPLPRDFLATSDSFRLDPSHAPPSATNQPAADVAGAVDNAAPSAASAVWTPPRIETLHETAIPATSATQELNEPALQVDRFAWPSVCLTLLDRADALFASLVDELFAGVNENRKLLAVSGYRRGSGRTTFLLSAARALAARGARVVVADADWDTPHLAERLGVSPEVGWQDVLTGGLPLEEALIESLIDGVTLLPARPNRSRTRAINFATAERNLEQLRTAYDFVLLDAGRLDDSTEGKIGSMLLEKMPIEGVLLVHDVSTSSLINPSITERRLAQMQIRWWRVVENFVRPSK